MKMKSRHAIHHCYQFLLILLLITPNYHAHAALEPVLPSITLTQAEQQWLDKQETIRFSITNHQKPIIFTNSRGEVKGVLAEYVDILSDTIGKEITLIPVEENPLNAAGSADEHKFHGHFSLFKNPALDEVYLYSQSYMSTPLYVFTTQKNSTSIISAKSLPGKKVAILKGHMIMMQYAASIDNVEIVIATTPLKQMELLQYGKVDAILGYKTYHSVVREFLFNNIVPAFSSDTVHQLQAGILMEYPQLQSILDKAIISTPESIIQDIIEKWINIPITSQSDPLTKEEHEWLNKQHTVRVRVSDWPPYMFKEPSPSGMSIDYLNFVSQRYNIDIQYVTDDIDWETSQQDLKKYNDDYDLILTMTQTPDRHLDFALTAPYLKMQWAIFEGEGNNFISSIDDLKGKRVAVERGFFIQKKLQHQYPEIIIDEVNNSLEALLAVSTGECDAYIGNLANSTFLIRENGLNNLQVSAPAPFDTNLQVMAVRKDWPELASIISKTFASMTEQEKDRIKNDWLSVRYEYGINLWHIIFWVAVTILIASIIIFMITVVNRKLSHELKTHTKIENELEKYIEVVNENVMIVTVDRDIIITKVSDSFCKITQYSKHELLGKSLDFVLAEETPPHFFQEISKIVFSQGTWGGEIKNRAKNDEELWVHATVTPITNTIGAINGFTYIYQNITDKKIAEKFSVTDKLTGLFNRYKIEEVLPREMARAQRYNSPLAIAVIDIDWFKNVNDTYGHQVGDKVLELFSQILKECTRDTDFVARWGGEEFLIICPETDQAGIVKLSEDIRLNIENFIFHKVSKMTASIGTTIYQETDTLETVIQRADEALYKAKEQGRNKVIFK